MVIFSGMFVDESLIEHGNAAATANNIVNNETLFRIGFVIDLISLVFWLILLLALYKLLKPVNKTHATLMAALALVLVPTLFINTLNKFAALQLLSDPAYLTVFGTDQLHAQAMFYLDLYDHGFNMNVLYPFGKCLYSIDGRTLIVKYHISRVEIYADGRMV